MALNLAYRLFSEALQLSNKYFFKLDKAYLLALNDVAFESFINVVLPLLKNISNLCGKPLNVCMASIKCFFYFK